MALSPCSNDINEENLNSSTLSQQSSTKVLSGNVLLVEDEEDIKDLITIYLEGLGLSVHAVRDGNDAIDLIQEQEFDLFVLDRMIPGSSGIEVCKFLRRFQKTKLKPILFITALTRSENIIEGLEAGADDYVVKPFDAGVLTARVKSLMRRSAYGVGAVEGTSSPLGRTVNSSVDRSENVFIIGQLVIDMDQCKVWINKEEIALTVSEYRILCYMLKNSRKVLSRIELVKYIQGEEVFVTERTIDTHIFGLRKKLGDYSSIIETIRGIGYRVNELGYKL